MKFIPEAGDIVFKVNSWRGLFSTPRYATKKIKIMEKIGIFIILLGQIVSDA